MPVAKKCKLCSNINLYYKTIESYNIHVRDNHPSDVPVEYIGDVYQCNICKLYFERLNDFTNHISTAH